MRYLLAALTASVLTLAFVTNAPAQTVVGPYYGVPNGYVQQPYRAVVPAPIYAQPGIGVSIGTPALGLGINIGGPAYVPTVPVYPRPLVLPSYYPARYNNYYYPHNYHYYGRR